jgi:hypothetical protein
MGILFNSTNILFQENLLWRMIDCRRNSIMSLGARHLDKYSVQGIKSSQVSVLISHQYLDG